MSTLTKQMLDTLQAFVASVFVMEYAAYAEKALFSLKALFSRYDLQVCKPVKQGKGNKTVSHNSRERFYMRVSCAGTNCGIVLKPRFRKDGKKLIGLYGYHVAIDSDVTSTKADIESFLKLFDPDKISKGSDIDSVLVAAASRQLSEDIGNNFAQTEERKLQAAEKDAEKVAAFVSLSDKVWFDARKALLLVDADLVSAIDDARAMLQS